MQTVTSVRENCEISFGNSDLFSGSFKLLTRWSEWAATGFHMICGGEIHLH